MRISEKRQQELYSVIAETIMDLRIEFEKDRSIDMDEKLFKLQFKIWPKVKGVLNIKE